MKDTPQQLHVPVLLRKVVDLLVPKVGESYLDLTAGYGGHASAIISETRAFERATLIDRDEFAISKLADFRSKGARVMHADFESAARNLTQMGETFDMILLDLGVSSPQLDEPDRGFSFSDDGSLDMRMDRSQALSADTIVNRYNEKQLAKIIADYGEESPKLSAKIAHAIRINRPIHRTRELAAVIATVAPKRSKIHPATRSFQAIRIAVNDELGQIERTLPLLPNLLTPSGRIAIISFHSLEDRLVKNFLRDESGSGFESRLELLNKKPLSGHELDNNPRARSAKLRAAVKINNRKDLSNANHSR